MQYGQFPQFGQQQPMDPFAGSGQMSGMMPSFLPEDEKKKKGMNPLMMLSPMMALMSQNPKMGLAMLSPGIGIANLLGAFK